MDFKVEKTISNFVKNQFPSFYNEEGPDFMLFVKAYYEWMEESGQPLSESRELFNYRDIDNTVDRFLEQFQKKYLYGIPFQIITNKRFLLKHILDVYRSKGSIQSYKLLFKLVYGEDIDIYLPAVDILKPSDGVWIQPRYLELTDNTDLSDYVGGEIIGISSGTTAVVESYVRQSLIDKNIAVLYISNILPLGGDFLVGEKIILKSYLENQEKLLTAPAILGSLDVIEIIGGGKDHFIGDIFKIARNDIDTNELISWGVDGQVKASSLLKRSSLSFVLIKGGFGYTANSDVYVVNNPQDKSGKGATFDLGPLVFQQQVTYNTDIIGNAILANGNIFDTAYTYMSNTSANLFSTIGESLSWKTENFGSIGSLINLNYGNNYITSANVFVRSTVDSKPMPGNVSYNSVYTLVYRIDTIGVGSGYTNSDVITIVNSGVGGTNAVANIVTNSTGGSIKAVIYDYGSNFSAPSSNVIVTTSGTGITFKPIFLPYVIGTNTKFTSVLSNNSVITLKANSSWANTEKILVREVLSDTALILYSNPVSNSTSTATYAISPTILPAQFPSYANVMINYNNEIHGENELILAPFSSSNDAVGEVKPVSSGFGYADQELVRAYMYGSISDNFDIVNGGVGYANNEKVAFVGGGYPSVYASGRVVTNANGTITDVLLDRIGSGYEYPPLVTIQTANGTNATIFCSLNAANTETEILGRVVLKGSGQGKGYWETTKGFLNSDKYIQDSYYYQDFSYEIQAARSLESYKNILYNTFHSSGSELFGKVLINDSQSFEYQLVYEDTNVV